MGCGCRHGCQTDMNTSPHQHFSGPNTANYETVKCQMLARITFICVHNQRQFGETFNMESNGAENFKKLEFDLSIFSKE